jgi:DNA-binding MarR family transcriptional regulator
VAEDLTPEQYCDLAEFRRQIRQFLYFSEATAKEHAIEPQQHQLLLAVHGLPAGVKPTIREIADRLFIQHHSAVELINRLEAKGAVQRYTPNEDRREARIRLTPKGRTILRKLTLAHRNELFFTGPALIGSLKSVLRHKGEKKVS